MEQLFGLFSNKSSVDVSSSIREERQQISREIRAIDENSRFNITRSVKNFITKEMCEWIIYESELYASQIGGWTKTRHKNYPTTDLPVKSMGRIVAPLMNLVVVDIFPIIAKTFGLNRYLLNIVDLFVVKYDVDYQNHLDFHQDGSIISFNILLNDDFEGGGTIIRHKTGEVTYESEKCELFIHSGKVLHSGRAVTSGRRYIIVGFIEYSMVFKEKGIANDTKYSSNEGVFAINAH